MVLLLIQLRPLVLHEALHLVSPFFGFPNAVHQRVYYSNFILAFSVQRTPALVADQAGVE